MIINYRCILESVINHEAAQDGAESKRKHDVLIFGIFYGHFYGEEAFVLFSKDRFRSEKKKSFSYRMTLVEMWVSFVHEENLLNKMKCWNRLLVQDLNGRLSCDLLI